MSIGKLSRTNVSNESNRNHASSPSHPGPRSNEPNRNQTSSPAHSSKDRFIAAKEKMNTKHALEEIQGGGKIPDLSILKKDLKAFTNFGESKNPCDTGTICQGHVTRQAC